MKLNPGSVEAREAGCVCPVLDNEHGHGWCFQKGVFVIVEDCPLHGKEGKNVSKKCKECGNPLNPEGECEVCNAVAFDGMTGMIGVWG